MSVDIVAHEFTHGVTEYAAGLQYVDESGAANESFSDIFGTAVEYAVGINPGGIRSVLQKRLAVGRLHMLLHIPLVTFREA